jgi:hypothetical protein
VCSKYENNDPNGLGIALGAHVTYVLVRFEMISSPGKLRREVSQGPQATGIAADYTVDEFMFFSLECYPILK